MVRPRLMSLALFAVLLCVVPAGAQAPACAADATAGSVCIYLPLVAKRPYPTGNNIDLGLGSFYRKGGFGYIIGQITNNNPHPIYAVQMLFCFSYSNTTVDGCYRGAGLLDAAFPGESIPFIISYPLDDHHPSVSSEYGPETFDITSPLDYVGLTVSQDIQHTPSGWVVTGTVYNQTDTTVHVPRVAATLYKIEYFGLLDPTTVAVQAADAIGGDLAPKHTTTYTLAVEPDVPYDWYQVRAQSYVVP